ncbi:hypothetical protein BROUX41_000461 [Berkeleyomyces rouxiae]|uniref:uncharacterized protein n=1 Tax=Berkeleyomyces rouxiae TaxID=2035830 RepID=UPI003B7B5E66
MAAKPVPGLQERLNFLTDSSYLLATSSPTTAAFLMRKRAQLLDYYEIPTTEAEKHRVCSGCSSISTLGVDSNVEIETGVRHLVSQRRMAALKRKRALAKEKETQKGTGKENTKAAPNVNRPDDKTARVGVSKVTKCHRCSSFTKSQIALPPASLRFRPMKKRKAAGKKNTDNQTTQSGADNAHAGLGSAQAHLAGPGKTQQNAAAPLAARTNAGLPTTTSAASATKKRKKAKNGGLQALLANQKKPSGSGLSLADFMMK